MNLLSVENLSKSFGENTLFEDVTFGIAEGEKVALIARNGAGKTTLLNILTGREQADEGRVVFRDGIRVAYLEQDPIFPHGLTLEEVLMYSDNPRIRAIQRYQDALSELDKTHSEEAHKELDEATALMEGTGAWDFEARVREVLGKFGLDDRKAKLSTLSGGQKKKLALARVLIEENDLLILDEPTNHLDIEMIEWLEGYLSRSRLSLLLVTHDRYFLDNVCTRIFELDYQRLMAYNGDYAYFLIKKAEREEIESQEREKNRNIYSRELEWMRRMPQARTTKSKAREEAFFKLEEKVKKKGPAKDPAFIVDARRMGKKIMELNNVHKSFGNKMILHDFSYTFKKGERIGLVGPNGCGKTSMLQMLAGFLRPDKGKISTGATVEIGYFTQDSLPGYDDMRLIDMVREVADDVIMGGRRLSASQFLSHFRYSGPAQYNYYGNLSGGEKRRIHLLLSLMRNPNFLMLDEPTNDLDVYTLGLLEEFLQGFDGCMMIASHDRAFLDHLVDHVFVFRGDGSIRDFPGNYTQYRQARDKEERLAKLHAPVSEKQEAKSYLKKVKKPSFSQLREFEQLESEIATLEAEQEELIRLMGSGEQDHKLLMQWSERASEVQKLLEGKSQRWLELGEIIDELQEPESP